MVVVYNLGLYYYEYILQSFAPFTNGIRKFRESTN